MNLLLFYAFEAKHASNPIKLRILRNTLFKESVIIFTELCLLPTLNAYVKFRRAFLAYGRVEEFLKYKVKLGSLRSGKRCFSLKSNLTQLFY